MMRESKDYGPYIEAVPTIINVIGKFFLHYGLPCTLHELIEDMSSSLYESKFKLPLDRDLKIEEDDNENLDEKVEQSKEDSAAATIACNLMIPTLSHKYSNCLIILIVNYILKLEMF